MSKITSYDGVDYLQKTRKLVTNRQFKPKLSSLNGPQLSGKTWLANALSLACQKVCPKTVIFLDTSDLVDKAVTEDSKLAKALIKELGARKEGRLMSDDPIIQVVFRAIHQKVFEGYEEIVTVGFPRTIPQGEVYLEGTLKQGSFLYLKISPHAAVKNLHQRLGEGSGRHDDAAKSVSVRQKEFETKTEPLIRYVQGHRNGNYVPIDADKRDLEKVLPVVEHLCLNGSKHPVIQALKDPYGPAGHLLFPDLHRAIKQKPSSVPA